MSYFLLFTTLFLTAAVGISFWKTYHVKIFLHPAFWFCVLWVCCIFSYFLLNIFPSEHNYYFAEHVNELYYFVLCTSIFFYVCKNIGRRTILSREPELKIDDIKRFFSVLAFVCLICSITNFILSGASFDFFSNRNKMVEYDTAMFYGEEKQSLIRTLLGVMLNINYMLAICAGFFLCSRFQYIFLPKEDDKKRIAVFILFIPLLASFFDALSVGGRNVIVIAFRLYIFGSALAFCSFAKTDYFIQVRKLLKKFIYLCAILLILFMAYSNYNLAQRYEMMNLQNQGLANMPVWARPFASIIVYFGCATTGYQLRRNDFVTEKLDYGRKTFSGVLSWQLPFFGLFGIKASLGNIFDIETYSMKTMFLELQQRNALFFSSVATMYLLLYDDFGFWGTIFFCFFLVLITQLLYWRWFLSDHKNFFSLYLLLIFFWLWSNSIFDPVFATGYVKTLFYSCLCLEVIRYSFNLIRDRNNTKNFSQ